jgi:O-antigen ligase
MLAARQSQKRQIRDLVLIGLALVVLVATASRSGLLACLTFAALVLPRVRFRWMVFAVIAIVCAIPLVPQEYWTRLGRTLMMQRGTFEAYTSLIRVYGWKTAIDVFLHQPLLGVGYVAYSAVSGAYGALRIHGLPVDNFYLETAAGMGLFGLIALAVVIVRVFQLGAVVRRLAPAGTLGHAMARHHTPLWIGMLIVNLTGNNFLGIVVLGQIALWSAMLVRSCHMALEPKPS